MSDGGEGLADERQPFLWECCTVASRELKQRIIKAIAAALGSSLSTGPASVPEGPCLPGRPGEHRVGVLTAEVTESFCLRKFWLRGTNPIYKINHRQFPTTL